SAVPSSWVTVTLCPLAREKAAASSFTPGVAPWLVRMTSSAAADVPRGSAARLARRHTAASFAQAFMASSRPTGGSLCRPAAVGQRQGVSRPPLHRYEERQATKGGAMTPIWEQSDAVRIAAAQE